MDFIDKFMLANYIKQNVCNKLHINQSDVNIIVVSFDEINIEFKSNFLAYDEALAERIATESIDFFTKERGKFYVREL